MRHVSQCQAALIPQLLLPSLGAGEPSARGLWKGGWRALPPELTSVVLIFAVGMNR